MKLKGLNIVVTGANRGLGLEMAGTFLREGASLVICARDAEKLAEAENTLRAIKSGGSLTAKTLDVSDETAVRAFAAQTISELGRVHVLVNNAGIYGPKGPLEEVNGAEWIKAVQINLFGVFYVCRSFIPHMKAAGGGKIINLSGGGATNPLPMISAYAASKAAVVRLSETLALELRPFNILVNAIAPGALNTRLLDEVLASGPDKVGKEFYNKALKQKENGGAPLEKGAALAAYLASAEGDGITGKLISAVWDPWRDFEKHKAELAASDIYTLRRIVPEDRGRKW
ncbi:MAG: dehydrogenase [Elusimicrobia bacterium GWC2_51_8]|nr:MAG: dehydrogenase [Elusimicrobia bacterium GWA2_51_34]OGR65254.1 MAG: dehydrogenase [Elusimicrobia bacterium GWC2_51_8]OGR88349.1 MAG: dehydrogenase [Elusimicrobia bacterium GWF2_52_66]HAF94622.1 dehydrogenase [Elusimicrobiota bacterium]HCE98044.1 dehydrogenase [Elusimicrobiota bacterium]